MDRQQFLEVLTASWHALDAAVAGLDASALNTPGVVGDWSAVEVLGHVSAWEQQALRHIEQWQRGEPLTPVGGPSVDAYNATESNKRRGWSPAQILAEQAETRQRLRTVVEALSDEQWATALQIGERQRSLGEIVAGDLGGDGPGNHAAEHARQIRAWRSI